ncbi:MAG: cell envelope biogenesis protein TolA [Afipia sp.]|nr:cell envelope biogenesis protein TolA [Afipia sp.]
MVVKFLSKYILEVIPSVVATVVGAYIVTHYINAKPDADKPKSHVAAPAQPAKAEEPVKAVEAPAAKPPAKSEAKTEPEPAAKPEKSSETASIPAEPRRFFHPKPRTKLPAETAKVEDTRDANEIAREAIARLRSSEPAQAVEAPRAQPAPRQPERANVGVTYVPASAPIQAPPVQPLPSATNMVPPLNETTMVAPAPQPPIVRETDASRPMPPADIPSRPLDIRAKERTSVAEDVVATAKSVFHAVIPGTN